MRRLLLLITAVLLAACDAGGKTAPPPPPGSGWRFQYSPGMSAPIADGQGGVYFDFPSRDGVHYLVQGRTAPLSGAVRAEIEVTMSPGAVLTGPPDPKNTCPPTPHFSFYFQRVGDDVTDARKRQYRWFSPYITIEPAAQSLVVPLTVDQGWIDVFGNGNLTQDAIAAGFVSALAQPQAVGMTFGHGCFAGHGLFMGSGTARFHIKSFSVQ